MWCCELADPCESLFNSRFNFFSSSGFRSVIYQLNGHWNSATKWHFKDGLTAARLLDFQKSKNNGCTMTQQNKNLQKLGRYSTFFTISVLISDCSSRVLKGVLVPEADLSALYLFSSSTNKLPDLELQSAHLHFRSIMCQSAWRRHREVSLISSATRCCHLQSTPWCCKEENKPKFCLLIYWECGTNESFTLLWSITVTNTISSKTPSGWVKVKATIFLI